MSREAALVEIEAACALSRYLSPRLPAIDVQEAAQVFSQERSALEKSLREQPHGMSRLETWRIGRLCSAWQKMSTAAREWFEIPGSVGRQLNPLEHRLLQFSAIAWGMSGASGRDFGGPAARCLAGLEAANDAYRRGDRLPADAEDRQRAMALQAAREATDQWVATRKATLSQLQAPWSPPRDSRIGSARMSSMTHATLPTSLLDGTAMSLGQMLGLQQETPARSASPPSVLPAISDPLAECLEGRLPAGSMPRIAFELPRHGGERYEQPKDFHSDLEVARRYLLRPAVQEHACGRTLCELTGKVCAAMSCDLAPPVRALAGLLETARRASVCIDARQALTTIALQIEELAPHVAPDAQREARSFQCKLRELDTCMNDAGGQTLVVARHGRFAAVEEQWRGIENRIDQLVRGGAAMLRPKGGTALARQGQWKTGSPDSPSSTPI